MTVTPTYAFLSYSRQDAGLVRQLATYLAQEEIPAWVDNQLEFGDRWEDVIEQRIRGAGIFLIAMSTASRTSAFVAREIRLALDEKKPIIPILMSGEPFDELASFQYIPLMQIPRTPRFVERLRDVLAPSQIPSANVFRRRLTHLALATFEELLRPGEQHDVAIELGFGLGRYFKVALTESLRDMDDLDWLEAFMILREHLPSHEFPFVPGENYGARYPTIETFVDFLARELTWEDVRNL